MITNPTVQNTQSGRGSGTITGAAQGAAAGAAVGGPVGAVVGGVIGGIAGWLGGSEQDKSQKHANLAFQYAKMQKLREAAIARRDKVREFRMMRSAAMMGITQEEGGTRSSSPQGSVSGLQAQYGFNINYFDTSAYIQSQYQKHTNKAGKHAAAANMIMSTTGAVASAVGSMGYNGLFSPGKPSGTPTTPTGTSTGTTYAPTWSNPSSAGLEPR
jgi:hypothetical protein